MTSDNNDDNQVDPVLSVYINHERRFCFLEFREVGMATACMALDGININGKGKVKVKRPNDYNPTMAPTVHPSSVPVLDVSRLGIISSNVQDGPNKVFIGGKHINSKLITMCVHWFDSIVVRFAFPFVSNITFRATLLTEISHV